MSTNITKDFENFCPNKPVLTIQEVATLLDCDPKIVQNCTKRSDPNKRTPRLIIGKEVRFPRQAFCDWLYKTQMSKP